MLALLQLMKTGLESHTCILEPNEINCTHSFSIYTIGSIALLASA